MKLIIDEKLKHRLVGVCVVLSLGAIFLPAMMKKSSQRLGNSFSVHVTLPPKPKVPQVVVTDQKEMFRTLKVARIKSRPLLNEEHLDSGKEDFIQPVKMMDDALAGVTSAANALVPPIEHAVLQKVKKKIEVAAVKEPPPAVKMRTKSIKPPSLAQAMKNRSLQRKESYAVQLASFLRWNNAQSMVNTLNKKGYKAYYMKTATKNGFYYKVYVGHSAVKNDAMKLKTELASAMQLYGYVVKGVS